MTIEQAAALGVVIVGAVALLILLVWFSIEMLDLHDYDDSMLSKVLHWLGVVLLWMVAVTALIYFGSQPMGVG